MMHVSMNIVKAVTDNKHDSNEQVMDQVTKTFTKDDIRNQIKQE